ncbi:MAG: transketolase C-terminal domain-containing protein [Pseudomonadota bacterium]
MRMTFAEACVAALAGEMRNDPNVFVMGEDVGAFGGPLKSTAGLFEEFGPRRVIDMPMAESAIVGLAVGAALDGKKPVVDLMFLEFLPLIMQQLVDAGAMHYYSGGVAKAPLVIRAKFGVGPFHGHAYDFHSWATHVPGVKVVAPANPTDAKGLLTAAVRDPNPVLFIEHMGLYHSMREEVEEGAFETPIGSAAIARAGDDVTLITYGAMVRRAKTFAEKLDADGVSAEVLDLRTLAPLDRETIVASVSKTGRAVILSEAIEPGGGHNTVAALIGSTCFSALKGPVQIVCPPPVPVPFHRALEKAYIPDDEAIRSALLGTGLSLRRRPAAQ